MARVDLNQYELGEQIGAGTVGTIFEARHKLSGKTCAIKFLSPAVGNSPLVVSRFAREMMILEKLSHPNILEYYGGGESEGQLFFVMELIHGGTLKEMISQTGTLSWKEACEVARQLAAALQHAHNHGIIHRDLKPGNVFVTREGDLKLGDFGIARDTHEQDLTETGLTVGTYSYMAPELVRGEKGLTGQVDLYALGCVIFEMLAGHPPFQGDNFAQIFEQHLNAEPPQPSQLGINCPEKLESLLTRLLAKDPENRPFNARSVQGFLGELLESKSDESHSRPEDRAAGEIRLPKELLVDRVADRGAPGAREISWKKLATLGILTLTAILLAVAFGRGQ